MAKNTEKNALECNKRAREKYIAENYTRVTVRFRNEEMEELNAYCEKHGLSKNGLIRAACMDHIGKSID